MTLETLERNEATAFRAWQKALDKSLQASAHYRMALARLDEWKAKTKAGGKRMR